MRVHQRLDAGADIRRKGRGFSRIHVDVNGHVFRRGGQPALAGMAQFLERVQSLFVGADQQDRDLHGIAEGGILGANTAHGIRR